MSGKTTAHEATVLNIIRGTNVTAPGTVYLALFSVAPSDAGGGTEFTGNGYARQSIAFAAPSGTPRSIANSAQVTFPVFTAGWATKDAVAWGIFDASTNGNLLYWAYFSDAPFPATADPTGDTLNAPGSAFTNDDPVVLAPLLGYALPAGLSEGTVYYVKSVSGDSFQLAATPGGGAINITSDGFALVAFDRRKSYAVNDQPVVAASALVIMED